MKITEKQKTLIQNYLEFYYSEFSETTEKLSLKNQLKLLYDFTTHIVK